MTAYQQALVDWALYMADNNNYHYYYWYDPTASNLGPWGFDCATYLSRVIYFANDWNDWPNHGSPGYFWPHTSEPNYDSFLLNNGWQKFPYSDSYLTEGAIIIMDETWGHTFMYIGNNQLVDANDFGGTDFGPNSIAVRNMGIYPSANYEYIYLPPDVTPGPGPGPGPGPDYFAYTKRRRRRVFS